MTQTAGRSRALGFVIGFLVALLVVLGGAWAYLQYGHLSVATADSPLPFEKRIVRVPMKARIAREIEQPTVQADETSMAAGATIYAENCAACHGVPGKDVPFAKNMFPTAPQLWKSHRAGVVGVSDDEAGETYWKVKNGIRLSGMPSFKNTLSEQEMWQVTMLLKNADKPMSPTIQNELVAAGSRPGPAAAK